ncbi:hypothetical protein [Rhizobium leguminosarum]|uniref:hypothetical protein n=1 Tax=Rhizobium leguminosarum TaxID=384 RepID=UPI001C956CF5|nr:hypothetical protein [Rhizobium leguminosarum]MBY5591648.1 hypothetical protein [Rhizobium leguminosarum]UIK19360.1 hypothetical protein LZK79_10230 [Rhizobium leguminosarum]
MKYRLVTCDDHSGVAANSLPDSGHGGRRRSSSREEQDLHDRFVRHVCTSKNSVAYWFRLMKAVEHRLNWRRPAYAKLDLGCPSTFYKRISEVRKAARLARRAKSGRSKVAPRSRLH